MDHITPLQQLVQQIEQLKRTQDLPTKIVLLREAIQLVEASKSDRELWAELQSDLGDRIQEIPTENRSENLEEAISCYMAALQVFTRDAYPQEWAMTQHNLAVAYKNRIVGNRAENVERSISCFIAALQILGRSTFPLQWAKIHMNLGNAYGHRIAGDHAENLETAINCFEAALEVFTRESYPLEWDKTQYNLGNTYTSRIAGERAENLERAIVCFTNALQIRSHEKSPEWARVQAGLGSAYAQRIQGVRVENQDRAVVCYMSALQVLTIDTFPVEWARILIELGTTWLEHTRPDREKNLEFAIQCFTFALQVCTRKAFPIEWAKIQGNLGGAYAESRDGSRSENLERAIVCHNAALQVFTQDAFPIEWAHAQNNLGNAYAKRISGVQNVNLAYAILCHSAAASVFTLNAFPREHRNIQTNLAVALATQQKWLEAHEAYQNALAAERLLADLGSGAIGRELVWKEGRNISTGDGLMLTRLARISEAAVTIENGRARGLAEWMKFDAANSAQIRDIGRRTRYEEARASLIDKQRALGIPINPSFDEGTRRTLELAHIDAYRQAKKHFEGIIDEIEKAQDPIDFLQPGLNAAAILQAAEHGGPDHAIIYLIATYWGGTAVVALSTDSTQQREAQFAACDLPELTYDLIFNLGQCYLQEETGPVIGGFISAQIGDGLNQLLQGWEGETLRACATAMHTACLATGNVGMLDCAVQTLLENDELESLVNQSLDDLRPEEYAKLDALLGDLFMRYELERCLPILADKALCPLARWLSECGVFRVTLIPCGRLATFPLASVEVAPNKKFSDRFSTSIAPSVRVWEAAHQRVVSLSRTLRPLLLTVGNPHPLPRGFSNLFYAAAEAEAIQYIANDTFHFPQETVCCLRSEEATREHVKYKLNQSWYAHLALHGEYQLNDPRRSRLILAGDENTPEDKRSLYLREILDGTINLKGMRLLVLSACETARVDVHNVPDEMLGLAVGFLQAGVAGVIASLWRANDRATYLLMSRFAQLYLDPQHAWNPSQALAEAQRWLREEATNAVLAKFNPRELAPFTSNSLVSGDFPDNQLRLAEDQQRSLRLAIRLINSQAKVRAEKAPNALPFAHPIYWAGFVVTGC